MRRWTEAARALAGSGREALRRGQGQRLRHRRGVGRRSGAAGRGHRRRGRGAAPPLPEAPILVMGALTEAELRRADGMRTWRLEAELPGALLAGAGRPAAGPRPRKARQRHGAPGRPRLPTPSFELARACARTPAWSWPASGPTSPRPTRTTPPTLSSSSPPSEPVAERCARSIPRHRARRQQRRDAARAEAPTSTWSAAASRSTGWTRCRGIRPTTASSRRCRCTPTSPT